MAVVQLGYETWRRRLPSRKKWDELTIAEAEIAAGMWGMAMADAAMMCDHRGYEGMALILRNLLDGKS